MPALRLPLASRLSCLLFPALLLFGCPKAKIPPGYVIREWSQTLRELGIVPIFPPREDVQVGDIYAYPWDPEEETALQAGSRDVAMSARWTSLDFRQLLTDEYARRPSWPPTPKEYSEIIENPGGTLWNQPTSGEENVFQGGSVPNRLRLVGFPEFAATTFSQGDLSALIPVEALNLALGISWSDAKSVTVKIPSAESYGAPLQSVLQALLEGSPGSHILKQPYRQQVASLPSDENGHVWLRVIAEVYYARAMDIAVQSQRTRGGRVGAGGGAATTVVDPTAKAVERAKQLNQALAQLTANTVPGGSFQFIAVTDTSVSMRRVWERGIAIGFRGLVLQVVKADGKVLKLDVSRSAVPTVAK